MTLWKSLVTSSPGPRVWKTSFKQWLNVPRLRRRCSIHCRPSSKESFARSSATSSTTTSTTASDAPHAPALVQRTPEVVKQAVKAERRIHLDVVVTDASGHAVSGLQSSDFTVLDDNRPQRDLPEVGRVPQPGQSVPQRSLSFLATHPYSMSGPAPGMRA